MDCSCRLMFLWILQRPWCWCGCGDTRVAVSALVYYGEFPPIYLRSTGFTSLLRRNCNSPLIWTYVFSGFPQGYEINNNFNGLVEAMAHCDMWNTCRISRSIPEINEWAAAAITNEGQHIWLERFRPIRRTIEFLIFRANYIRFNHKLFDNCTMQISIP